jgi:hypothetical protein
MQTRFLSNITLGSLLQFIGIGILVTLLVVYVHFQARFFLQGPIVTLFGDYTPLQHTRTIKLEGSTQNIVKLTLNGREIHTTESGMFSQEVILENGYSILEIHAQDRFGRTTTLKREYVYVPKEA